MKVRELISILLKLDGDRDVYLHDYGNAPLNGASDVKSVKDADIVIITNRKQ